MRLAKHGASRGVFGNNGAAFIGQRDCNDRERRTSGLLAVGGLFSHDRHHNGARMRRAAVFEEENSLPCSKGQPAAYDRDDFGSAGQNHAQMRGHVVRALVRVHEIGRVFGHKPLKERMQVDSGRGIGVFINHQTCAGVLDKNRQRSSSDTAFEQRSLNAFGDFVSAFALGGHSEAVCVSAHLG